MTAFLPPTAPPNNSRLEETVLATMLNYAAGLLLALELLPAGAETFYQPWHQALFRAIERLHYQGKAVDAFTVAHQLAADGQLAGHGEHEVIALVAKSSHAHHLRTHCQDLVALYSRRYIYRELMEVAARIFDQTQPPFPLLAQAQQRLYALTNTLQTRRPQLIGELYEATMDEIQWASEQPAGLTGVTSGLTVLDRETGGWQPGDLIIIAARPGMGKTSFALACALAAARQGVPGVFFSLEMRDRQLVKKIIGNEAGYSTSTLTRGSFPNGPAEAAALRVKAAPVKGLPLWILDTPGLSLGEFRATATKFKAEHNVGYLVVDYLQLMTAPEERGRSRGNREQEIAAISRGLKLTAKELNVPVLALAQLSRGVDARPDKRPILSDLRESGSIEQDADVILFPFRPEYYGIREDAQGNSTLDLTELGVAKHRNGATFLGEEALVVRSVMKYSRYSDEESAAPPALTVYRTPEPAPGPVVRPLGPMRRTDDSDPPF